MPTEEEFTGPELLAAVQAEIDIAEAEAVEAGEQDRVPEYPCDVYVSLPGHPRVLIPNASDRSEAIALYNQECGIIRTGQVHQVDAV